MAADQERPEVLHQRLVTASAAFSLRGLVKSAQWAADLANALDIDISGQFSHPDDSISSAGSDGKARINDFTISFYGQLSPSELATTFLAKTYFDTREFQRCAHTLKDCTGLLPTFLRCYATYLAGERSKEEAQPDLFDQPSINESLDGLRKELEHRSRKQPLDGYLNYLLGLVYKEQGLREKAWAYLIKSVCQEPLLWAAWEGLISLCHQNSDVDKLLADDAIINLSVPFVRDFFKAHVFVELQANMDAIALYEALLEQYPSSSYLIGQVACAYYNARHGDQAAELFTRIRAVDPFRLDNIDVYSNILYVQDKAPELSHLAQEAVTIDQYRPETCCVLGNYYSHKGEHHKAVEYFQRALKLNRRYLSAWTLVGHEYVELKNTSAAVAAYRQAIEINARDYRAWYGLGQTYELLEMSAYSIHYYNQAKRLRPYDPRMWAALGTTYEHIHKYAQAVQAYRMCVSLKTEPDVALLHRMAGIFKSKIHPTQPHEAAKLYELTLQDSEDGIMVDSEMALEACDFLSTYYTTIRVDSDRATKYANVLMSYGGPHKEHAKSVLARLQGGQTRGSLASPLGRSSERAVTTMAEEAAPPEYGGADSSMDMSDFS